MPDYIPYFFVFRPDITLFRRFLAEMGIKNKISIEHSFEKELHYEIIAEDGQETRALHDLWIEYCDELEKRK